MAGRLIIHLYGYNNHMTQQITRWGHQQSGTTFINQRDFAMINHEPGCGKTLTFIDATRELQVVLIVCPKAVGLTWEREYRKFQPERRVFNVTSGTAKKRTKSIKDAFSLGEKFVAIVINYESIWRPAVAALVRAHRVDCICLDESHRIKDGTSKCGKFLAKTFIPDQNKIAERDNRPAIKRVCLTGTPTPRDPRDWWSQFRFLDDTVLGKSYRSFTRRIAVMDHYDRYPVYFVDEGLEALTERIDPHIHKVAAEEVLKLPDFVHTNLYAELSDAGRKFYDNLEKDMIAFLENGEAVTAANKLVVCSRLMMATSGYARSEENEEVLQRIEDPPAKAQRLCEFLSDFPKEEPIVIIGIRHVDLDEIAEACRKTGRTFGELSGRKKDLEAWQAGGMEALIVQMQAGNAGIDLTRASHCVYYSINHSNGDYVQSLARIRRPGQQKCCRYYHVVCENTIDETIYKALEEKRDIIEAVTKKLTRRV